MRIMMNETSDPTSSGNAAKAKQQRLYDAITDHLETLPVRDTAIFLNYGYVPDESPSLAVVAPAPGQAGGVSSRLILEVLGDCPLAGRDVLDVGCGRGGSEQVLHEHFPTVASVTGLDLSPKAVAFCRARHPYPNTRFVEGDAEHLPFPSESLDVVLNIESACLYPDVQAFYAEVSRVLRPGGHFLYADCMGPDDVPGRVRVLAALGLRCDINRDVTRIVILASDQVGAQRVVQSRGDAGVDFAQAATGTPQRFDDLMTQLACAPGSKKYDKFARGVERYVLFRFVKNGTAPAP
jgi:SAM-dependent methyltransferase